MRNIESDSHKQSLTSAEIEALLLNDFKKNKPVEQLKQPFSATSLFIPRSRGGAEQTLPMTDWSHPDKVVLYKAIIAAYNYAFFDKEAAISAKSTFSVTVRPFIEWLNVYPIENRYEILKRYETERMDAMGNHGGRSPLNRLITVLNYAIDSADFQARVSIDDYSFITELSKTKVSPNLNKTQKSLASYFGALDWLRRDDIGIGRELYSTLASPKLTVNSLSLTAATVILELSKYKSELIALIKEAPPELSQWIETDFSSMSKHKKIEYIGNVLYHIISAYHQRGDNFTHLKGALDVLLLSNASNEDAYCLLLDTLTSQEACDALFLNKAVNKEKVNNAFCKKNITSLATGCLFSWDILRSLSRGDTQVITSVDVWMFGWLMATLTVQPYDVPKLTSKSFRKMRVGGRLILNVSILKGEQEFFIQLALFLLKKLRGRHCWPIFL